MSESVGHTKTLSEELEELERTDPVVAEARRKLDDLPDVIARYERHMAARRAVGKRDVPKTPDCCGPIPQIVVCHCLAHWHPHRRVESCRPRNATAKEDGS